MTLGERKAASAPLDRLDSTLLHAALDPPDRAVAHWLSAEPETLLDRRLTAGTYPLIPLIWRNLSQAGFDGPSMPRLKGLARRTWFVNQAALSNLDTAVGALGADGIEPTVLGGAAIALAPWGWSGDIKYRSFADTAIMVAAAERHRALDAIRGCGFSTLPEDQLLRHVRLWREVDLISPDHTLRLVWSPSPWLTERREGQPPSPWWESRGRVSFGAATCRLLEPSDALLATCIDGLLSPWRQLVWIVDALRILGEAKDGIDLRRLLGIAAEHGVADVAVTTLSLLRDEFGAPLPRDLASPAPDRRADRFRGRRRRLAHTVARLRARSDGSSSLRADWGAARVNLSPRDYPGAFPAFLADRWKLTALRQVPGEAFRRAIRRLRNAMR